jgi:hypothetical protein
VDIAVHERAVRVVDARDKRWAHVGIAGRPPSGEAGEGVPAPTPSRGARRPDAPPPAKACSADLHLAVGHRPS